MENNLESGNLPGIIILTHGDFGTELLKSASMVFGEMKNVMAFPLVLTEDPEDYKARLKETMDSLSEDCLFLVDLFGGTPCNVLLELSRDREIHALTGVNLPQLISAVELRNSLRGEEWVEAVAEASHSGIVNLGRLMSE